MWPHATRVIDPLIPKLPAFVYRILGNGARILLITGRWPVCIMEHSCRGFSRIL